MWGVTLSDFVGYKHAHAQWMRDFYSFFFFSFLFFLCFFFMSLIYWCFWFDFLCLAEPALTHFSSMLSQHETKWHQIGKMKLKCPVWVVWAPAECHAELINCRMLAASWTLEDFIKIDLSSLPCTDDNDTDFLSKPQGQGCNIYPWIKAFSF